MLHKLKEALEWAVVVAFTLAIMVGFNAGLGLIGHIIVNA